MECFTYLRNIQDLWRFGMPSNGPVIPFGAMVEYHTISVKDTSRLHQFGAKVLSGICLGYALYAGRIWKGDLMVAAIEELEEMDASELHARRHNAKEVVTPQRSGNIIFPVADGTVRTIHLNPGVSRTRRRTRNSSRKSDELQSPTPLHDDSTQDDEEARSDFWTKTGEFIYRHHVEPRVKTVHAERRNISYSNEVHTRCQNKVGKTH